MCAQLLGRPRRCDAGSPAAGDHRRPGSAAPRRAGGRGAQPLGLHLRRAPARRHRGSACRHARRHGTDRPDPAPGGAPPHGGDGRRSVRTGPRRDAGRLRDTRPPARRARRRRARTADLPVRAGRDTTRAGAPARAGAELGLPIYLYARAATRPERERLPDVRKGEFEGLRERIGKDPGADPDFGPKRIHPTAGATAVGARPFLVAFNIYLDSPDVAIAKEIAKGIRTSSGGLPAVQASGFEVQGKAQVSMNLLDIDTTPPITVFAAVERMARARGVDVLKSEVVGLIPERALRGAGATALKLPDPAGHLLEAKIRAAEGGAATVDAWFDELSSAEPAPGGGSAAAFAGAMGAALVAMVARLTIGRKAYAGVEAEAQRVLEAATEAMNRLKGLVQADAAAYGLVRLAYQTSKTDPGRQQKIDQALLGAARTPLDTARSAVAVIKLAQAIRAIGNKNARSDATVGEHLGRTALAGALENVRVNVAGLSDPGIGKALLEEAERLAGELRDA
ncbi:MAG: hypothetical protein E6K55_13030 [Gemmatimonadetes bacterium]|nr:MAG: hypothetical protein DMD67_14715 [Gemmatimonadota bacterium]TLY49385.1 MAG: hypothetical protein E6K55_13030 [Gemmatimonadota bacterium]